MPIDPASYVPAYRQIADDLRERITSRALRPGERLPAEDRLASEWGVGKDTVRDALQILRGEGLIRTVRGQGSYVREPAQPEVERVEGPARLRVRMPTPEERRQFRMDEGVPVIVLDRSGAVQVFPADRVEIEIPSH
ncbi:GntR family transcriptional regulator [Spongiactinospora rosea]|uniref:GntR family transcriptional regulator n=1 Tax=Spongiactinospora rosea TaxID=2248750 RepID=A0A366M7W7_9ACTN|nr:GntR family transcriptional regulator [Spongiactinospora rosea]RBQ21639.1 GntR family transcriptional regulator [Spongiactinospora rosea]